MDHMTQQDEAPQRQSFRLILDDIGDAPADAPMRRGARGGDTEPATLTIAPGACVLYAPPGQPPRILDDMPDDGHGVFVLETFRRDHHLGLLIVSRSADRPRINGVEAPRLAVLAERDQLRPNGDGRVLHVSRYMRPYRGAPPHDLVAAGASCALCHTPIRAESWVYICPFCDAAMHLEDDEHKAGDKPLHCGAAGTTCASCMQPTLDREGLTYVPREVNGG